MKPLVRLSLIAGVNDPSADHEILRQKLEPQAQKWLDSYLKAQEPNSSRSILRTLLATGWLLVPGRKVCFELEVDGVVKSTEVTNVNELDELIGDHTTPSTFLQALGGVVQPM